MENQHRQIKGYRELNAEEIALMNNVKALGVPLQDVILMLQSNKSVDQRWVNIGVTQLQQGLMALTRSIAKPTFF